MFLFKVIFEEKSFSPQIEGDYIEKTDSDTSLVTEKIGGEDPTDTKEGVKGGDVPTFTTPNKLLSSARKKIRSFARSLSVHKGNRMAFSPSSRVDYLSGRKSSSRGQGKDLILYHKTEAV